MSSLDEAGADERLRSYVARIKAVRAGTDLFLSAPQFEAVELRSILCEPWTRICAGMTAIGPYPKVRAGRKVWWRGVYCTSKLLGCDAEHGSQIMRRATWLSPLGKLADHISANCPNKAVGHVYAVECPDHPGVIKIGFSSQIDKQLKQLEREYKVRLRVCGLIVGTYLDEFVAQRALGDRWLVNEWFGSAENPQFCPEFIRNVRGAPVRETAERYLEQMNRPGLIPNTGPFRSPIEAERDEQKSRLH